MHRETQPSTDYSENCSQCVSFFDFPKFPLFIADFPVTSDSRLLCLCAFRASLWPFPSPSFCGSLPIASPVDVGNAPWLDVPPMKFSFLPLVALALGFAP